MTMTYNGIPILTTYDPKPGPSRKFDWVAVLDNYDLGSPMGLGPTEMAAIVALVDEIDEEAGGLALGDE